MKILFVIRSLKNRAGSERVACLLANLFITKLGYDVSIINTESEKDDVAYELNEQVKVYKFSKGMIDFYVNLKKVINLENPNFVIVHNMGKLSLLCSLLKINRPDFQLFSLEHVSFSSRHYLIRLMSKIMYKNIDRVITLTNTDATCFKKFCSKVNVVRNISPYKITNLRNKLDNYNIIAIGRLSTQKNFIALLRAWKKAYIHIPAWQLSIYGKGEKHDELISFIAQNGLERVSLYEETENIESVYNNASFLVMSSLYEGLPMVLIESQSFGIPIISFDCPYGPSEIITNEKDGILVKNQDIDKLSEMIIYLASNSRVREYYSINALKSAERFSDNIILQEWKDLFEGIEDKLYV